MKRDPNCTHCKLHESADFVCLLGKGPQPCKVMIIGEAPGKREDEDGQPFVGKAGHYLDEILVATGIKRSSIFITNAVSCRPPDNRTPTKREIQACNHWLSYQFKAVKPKFVLLLGNTALQAITGEKGIKAARGKPFEKEGILYLPTYHPSFILRGDLRDDPIFRNDLKLFKSLVEGGGVPEEEALNSRQVRNEADFEEMLEDLSGDVSFDLETSGLYPWAKKVEKCADEKRKKNDPRDYDAEITLIGFGTEKYQWSWFPREFKVTQERLRQVKDKLDDCTVIGQYGKFDILWMRVIYGVEWDIDFDTGIAHYLLDENSDHGLKSLAQRMCNAPNWDVDDDVKKGNRSKEKQIRYHAHDLYYTRELKFILDKELRKDPAIRRVFRKIMMPCVKVFADAEYEGCFVDTERMDEVERDLRKRIKVAKKALKKWEPKHLDEPFKWSSPKQVGDLLYRRLKIECPEKTKTGANSTAESALKQIDHPIVKDLFALREANQQLSFFIEGWKPYLVDGRLHPSFKLTGTVTGRLSCEHPNFQQIPRDQLIRTLITAPPGWVLIEADLSQVELRIAAELSGDAALLQAFIEGQDPHWITVLEELRRGHGEETLIMATARKVLGRGVNDYDAAIDALLEAGADKCIEIDYRWKELRKKAKAVNFGFLYGMWWKKFKIYARDKYDVHLTDEQAQESRKGFFAHWRDLPGWHERQKRFARRNGYVRTLTGRKRRVPAAMEDGESFEKGEAQRQAINSPVQSFANEINLMALIQLAGEFPRRIYRPIATVHDAILSLVRVEHVEKIARRTLEVMRHPKLLDTFDIQLRVPLDADLKIGPWGAGIPLKKWLKENRK